MGLSDLGAGPLYFAIFILIFNRSSRSHSFYYILWIVSSLYFINMGKLVYHDPRPYMSEDAVIPHGCSSEYGNPSGHAL